jgi:NADP-dependent 3-hydroxy acid dehydrogenase YdfG
MTTDKVVLVTGASRGIGRAIALKFAENNFQTVITGRDTKRLKETADLIQALNKKPAKLIAAELRDTHDTSRLIGSTLQNFGRLDVLINNAGVLHIKPFLEITSDELEESVQTNFMAVFQLTQRVLPEMLKQGGGTIVNIASIAGKVGFPGGTAYSATKFALRGFAQSLMHEVRDKGVRIITVFPGSVNTDMLNNNPISASPSTALLPSDVAHVVFAAVTADPRATVSEIEIRPSIPKKKS